MRYPEEVCRNYEMPVAFVIGVPLLAVMVLILVVVRFIARVPSRARASVVPMVRMPIVRAENVNVRNLISGMTVTERTSRLSFELCVQQ
jgi:hypothetical protein